MRHLFAEHGGGSLSQLLNQAKIARAKEWLIYSRLPLKEIAYQCGFQTERNLSTCFKKLAGCSPRRIPPRFIGVTFGGWPASGCLVFSETKVGLSSGGDFDELDGFSVADKAASACRGF